MTLNQNNILFFVKNTARSTLEVETASVLGKDNHTPPGSGVSPSGSGVSPSDGDASSKRPESKKARTKEGDSGSRASH